MESPGHLKMEMAIFQPLPPSCAHTHTHILYINYPEHLQVGKAGGGTLQGHSQIFWTAGIGRAVLMGVQGEDSEKNFISQIRSMQQQVDYRTYSESMSMSQKTKPQLIIENQPLKLQCV